MATFPNNRILPVRVNAPGAALNPAPMTAPSVPNQASPTFARVHDQSRFVTVQSFVVRVRSSVE